MATVVDNSQPSITITLTGQECYGLGELLYQGVTAATLNRLGLNDLVSKMQKLQFGDATLDWETYAHAIPKMEV